MNAAEGTDDSFYRRAKAELDQAVRDGTMEITGYDERGDPCYRLTDKGREVVEQMSRKS